MEQDANARQRQLEREITCLKDSLWRLTSRVCVVESFLKSKYGQIFTSQSLPISRAPVKVIPIVISNQNQDHLSAVETETQITEVIVKGGSIEHLSGLTSESLTSAQIIPDTNDFSHAFGNDFHPDSVGGVEEPIHEGRDVNAAEALEIEETTGEEEIDEEMVEEGDQGDVETQRDSEGQMIRIYKPDWKTFVVVKSDPTPPSATIVANDTSVQVEVVSPLECHICQKKFSHQDNVQRHMLIHRAAQFRCDECGRGFNHQGNLNTHKLRHERVNRRRVEMEQKNKTVPPKAQSDLENRKFPCSFCDKRFYTSQQRNIHTRIHTGEKPFECSLCGMKFNQKASLQDHSLGHVGEKNNYCHLCPAGFVRSRNLLKHIRQVHKMAQIKTILNGERIVEFVPESEAAEIIASRKNNVEIKRPPKPRLRKPKQKIARATPKAAGSGSGSGSRKRPSKQPISLSEDEDTTKNKRVKVKVEQHEFVNVVVHETQEYIVP